MVIEILGQFFTKWGLGAKARPSHLCIARKAKSIQGSQKVLVSTCLALFFVSCTPSYKPSLSDAKPKEITDLTPLAPSQIGAQQFLIQGEIEKALFAYLDTTRPGIPHEMPMLKKIAKEQILRALRSPSAALQLLSIFAISISQSEELIGCLEEAMESPHPEVVLAAMRSLAAFNTDRAARSIQSALRSNYLGLRIEASYLLTEQKRIDASEQIEALMHKCPDLALGLFAQLFAKGGSRHDLALLAQLMSHSSPYVRSSAILGTAAFERRSLEPNILAALSHTHPLEAEAAAFAVGHLRLEPGLPRLKELTQSLSPAVQLAAWCALEKLGDERALTQIYSLAAKGNLFAIQFLGNYPSAQQELEKLLNHRDLDAAMNAALSLLHQKNPKGLPLLAHLLASSGVGFAEHHLPAHTDSCFVRAPIHSKGLEKNPGLIHSTLAFKQEIVALCLQLPDSDFFPFIDMLISTENSESISLAADALALRGSEACVSKLDHLRQRPGAPWLRMRCSLALYKITRDIKYLDEVKAWLFANTDREIIELIPQGADTAKLAREFSGQSRYELRPSETSALLIEAWMTLAHSESDAGLNLILEAMPRSPLESRLVLAGLLMKALK